MTAHDTVERTRILQARGKADTVSGVAEIVMPIPSAGRVLSGGKCWFGVAHADDYYKIDILDGDDVVVKDLYDSDLPDACQGWYFHVSEEIDPIDSPMVLVGGVKIRLRAWKGDASADTLRVNIKWGLS